MAEKYSSFISTVPSVSHPNVCRVCHGPCWDLGDLCQACYRHSQSDALLLDRVGISFYGVRDVEPPHFTASYNILSNYKLDFPSAEESRERMGNFLRSGLRDHGHCLQSLEPVTAWALIPSSLSSQRRDRPSRLYGLALDALRGFDLPEVSLRASGSKDELRSRHELSPKLFEVGQVPEGTGLGHLLLVDDTWTTGTSAQSACWAAKLFGFRSVSLYCVGRVLDMGYVRDRLPQAYDYFSSLPFNRDACPWGLTG